MDASSSLPDDHSRILHAHSVSDTMVADEDVDGDHTMREELPHQELDGNTLDDGYYPLEGVLALASQLLEEFGPDDMDVLNTAVTVLREGINDALSNANPNYSRALQELAALLWRRFQQTGQIHDLDETIALRKQAQKLPHPQHNDRSASLYDLAIALSTRYERLGLVPDLEETVSLHLQALEYRRRPHPDRQTSLDNLEISLSTLYQPRHAIDPEIFFEFRHTFEELLVRFESSSQGNDYDVGILLYRQALVVFHADVTTTPYLSALQGVVMALKARFKEGGRREDLEEVVSLQRAALALTPALHPNRSTWLNRLAISLYTLFKQGGARQEDLDEVVSLCREDLALNSASHPDRSTRLTNLAGALQIWSQQQVFEQGGGRREDLEEMVSLCREALALIPASHPDRSTSLTNLAWVLETSSDQQGWKQDDLEEVISLHRQALALRPASHPGRPSSLSNLGKALRTRFMQGGGQREGLEESVLLHRQALVLRPVSHPDRPSSLMQLANSLLAAFQRGTGQREDLEEAVSLYRQALALKPAWHPDHSAYLGNLANILVILYAQGGGLREDLKEYVLLHRQALALLPEPHRNRFGSLNNLANALITLFEQGGGQLKDLEESISLHRQALALMPVLHLDRPSFFNNLAGALLKLFEQGAGQREDLEEAVLLNRQALVLSPLSHPGRPSSLDHLAGSLLVLIQQGAHQRADLEEVVSLQRQALALTPEPHPRRFASLWNLSHTYLLMFALNGNPDDFEMAISLLSQATYCPSPEIVQNFLAAKTWTEVADKHEHPSTLEAFDAALRALPQLAAIHLNIQRRQSWLKFGGDGLARRAARCAIRAGLLGKAVEFLDTGRGVFWSQMLHLRPSFQDLPADLGNKLRVAADALEKGSHRQPDSASLSNEEKLVSEQEDSRLARLAKNWLELIQQVRCLPGFEKFLLPRPLSSLQATLISPVVLLIAGDESSDCLVVTPTNVHHIPLPHLTNYTLQTLSRLILRASSGHTVDPTSIIGLSESKSPQELPRVIKDTLFKTHCNSEVDRATQPVPSSRIPADDVFQCVLNALWDGVVKPVIDFLEFNKNSTSKDLPLLQWCPTGPFTFLPIHAAGCYENGIPSSHIFDYAISSYTPTISALAPMLNSTSTSQPFRMAAVIQSDTLPSTRQELDNIRRHVSPKSMTALGTRGSPASVEAVASRLADASIVHFACHGIQDRSYPLASGLKIEGEILTIARIMKEPIPHGSLAFLSACETAMGDQNLPDEAMSLGASLLFSGFRRVVATMWKMRDMDGPVIADAFYEELFRGPDGKPMPEPDTNKSALALHLAVEKLRADGAPFHAWVPFIHMGQ